MLPIHQILGSRRFKKTAAVAAALIVFYSLAGFFLVPFIAKTLLTGKVSRALNRPIDVGQVRANPYTLSIRLTGLRVEDPDGETFLSMDDFFINFQLASMVRQAAVIREISLVKPFLRIVRNPGGGFNFSDMGGGGDGNGTGNMPGFLLRNLRITDGSLIVEDRTVGRQHELVGIDFSLPFVSGFPKDAASEIAPVFSATLNNAPVAVSGTLKPFAADRQGVLKVRVGPSDIRPYLAYLPIQPEAIVESGAVQLDTTVAYREQNGRASHLSVSGPLVLSGLNVLDKAGTPVFQIPELAVVMSPANLLSRRLHMGRLTCRSPVLDLARDPSGKLNLMSLLLPLQGEAAAGASEPDDPEPAFSVTVDAVEVEAARLTFLDHTVAGPFKTVLEPVRFALENFRFPGEGHADFALSFQTEAGEHFDLTGAFALEPVMCSGKAALDGLVFSKYLPYVKDRIRFDITQGTLDASAAFRFEARENQPLLDLSDISVTLRSLAMADLEAQTPLVAVPLLTVADSRLDWGEKTLKIGRLFSEGGSIFCQRFKDGTLNMQHLVAIAAAPDDTEPAGEPEDSSGGWHVSAEEIRFSDYAFRYEDLSPGQPVQLSLDRMALTAAPFTLSDGEKSTVSADVRWNREGKIGVRGTISVKPVTADLSVSASGIDIRSFQPYIADHLNAVITDGDVRADGAIEFKMDEDGRPRFAYRGEASIVDFASMDPDQANEFVRWASLHMSGMTVGMNPNRWIVEKMAVSQYHTRIVINPDGTVNLNRVIAGADGAETAGTAAPGPPDEEKTAPPPEIRIGQVTFQDSSIKFMDLLNEPNFEADIRKLGGSISGLSSEKGAMAEVFLKGVEENTAPLEIRGRMHPFGDQRDINLALIFQDIEMSPFSAYSGKYLGYLVQKGKLHLDLEYEMLGDTLRAKNLIVMDQLTLGDKVESPEATSLPVAFAIALLKDRNGRIEINLPVRGDVKDPEFKIGKIVMKMIVNLVTKIVTSPFAALGAAFGGGAELDFVDFSPASSALNDAAVKKLDTLAKGLDERPALRMDIRGEVDPQKDRERLRSLRFEALLRAEKRKELAAAGQDLEKAGETAVVPEEYPEMLTRAYTVSEIPKPRDATGKIMELPVEEMEKLLMTSIQVTDGDLRLLAHERASRIKDYLLPAGQDRRRKTFHCRTGCRFQPPEPGPSTKPGKLFAEMIGSTRGKTFRGGQRPPRLRHDGHVPKMH